MEEIYQDLIINWDQTTVICAPVSNWTMATHKVAISGIDDKRQITLLLTESLTGCFHGRGKPRQVYHPANSLPVRKLLSPQTTGAMRYSCNDRYVRSYMSVR